MMLSRVYNMPVAICLCEISVWVDPWLLKYKYIVVSQRKRIQHLGLSNMQAIQILLINTKQWDCGIVRHREIIGTQMALHLAPSKSVVGFEGSHSNVSDSERTELGIEKCSLVKSDHPQRSHKSLPDAGAEDPHAAHCLRLHLPNCDIVSVGSIGTLHRNDTCVALWNLDLWLREGDIDWSTYFCRCHAGLQHPVWSKLSGRLCQWKSGREDWRSAVGVVSGHRDSTDRDSTDSPCQEKSACTSYSSDIEICPDVSQDICA